MRSIRTGFFLACLLACGVVRAAPVKVVASFSILGDFVRQVGGERVELTQIVGPNQDAHVYEPRAADVTAVARADLIVVNGLHFEGFIERLIKAGAGTAPVVALSDGVQVLRFDGEEASRGEHAHDAHDHDHGHEHDHDHDHDHDHEHDHAHAADHRHDQHAHDHGHHHGGADPHAWQSVGNAMIYVRNLAQALCRVDAQGCPQYRQRAQGYAQRLQALDAQIKNTLGTLPAGQRTVLTAHGAFNYFGQAYGLKFLSPAGLSTESEATAGDMRRLIGQLRQQQVAAIFLEHNANPRLVQRLAAETGMPVSGTLYADMLSASDGPAASYVDMMQYNLRTLVDGIKNGSASSGRR